MASRHNVGNLVRASGAFVTRAAGLRNRARRGIAIAASIAVATALSCCATGYVYNPDKLADDQIGAISHICADTMDLLNKPAHYTRCVNSLSESVRFLARANATRRGGAYCAQAGLGRGTPVFAECELSRAAVESASSPKSGDGQFSRADGFFPAPQKLPHSGSARMELACAQVGFAPLDDGFSQCVDNLKHEMLEASYPSFGEMSDAP